MLFCFLFVHFWIIYSRSAVPLGSEVKKKGLTVKCNVASSKWNQEVHGSELSVKQEVCHKR